MENKKRTLKVFKKIPITQDLRPARNSDLTVRNLISIIAFLHNILQETKNQQLLLSCQNIHS